MKTAWFALGAVGLLATTAGCAKKVVVPSPAISSIPKSSAEAAPAPQKTAQEVDLDAILRDTTLFFALDDSSLTKDSQRKLERLAEALKTKSGAKIRVEGHCDERGTVEYNLALGLRRASVARKFLVDLGVTPSVVDTISFGSERPAAMGNGEEAWAQNRRAELNAIQR